MKKFFTLVLAVVVLGLLGATGYYFKRFQETSKQLSAAQSENAELSKQVNTYKTDPQQAAQAETDAVIQEVGKSYNLPKDEKPSLYRVTDKEASKKQYGAFFDKAENGDISLIYTQAKLAILYRPSAKQIIHVSSVTIQDSAAPPAANP